MRQWPKVALGDMLSRASETAVCAPDIEYDEVTIRLWGKGVISRGKVRGADVTTPRRVVRANQLILSKIDARNGAIGLVPEELDGAIVSNDFPSYAFVDRTRFDPAFMGWMVRSQHFVELCKAASEGTTNRVRIKEDRFLAQQIALPSLAEQHAIVSRLDTLADKARQLSEHLNAIECDTARLLAARFRYAITDTPMRPMAAVAPLVRREVAIDPQAHYTELGIRSFYKGTFQRRTMDGVDYSWQNLFAVKAGDLIFSNIMAWEKAIAIAKPEDDGCVGNHRMLTCEVNVDTAVTSFLYYYFTTTEGFAKIDAASPGTAARNKTLKAQDLMSIEVPIPSISTQRSFDALQAKVATLKARHATIRQANDALIPATLERVFN